MKTNYKESRRLPIQSAARRGFSARLHACKPLTAGRKIEACLSDVHVAVECPCLKDCIASRIFERCTCTIMILSGLKAVRNQERAALRVICLLRKTFKICSVKDIFFEKYKRGVTEETVYILRNNIEKPASANIYTQERCVRVSVYRR